MDYAEFCKKVEEQPAWWKPEEGLFGIVVMGEFEERTQKFDVKSEDGTSKSKEKQRYFFKVIIDGTLYNWGVDKRESRRSLCFKICKLAELNNNKMDGLMFRLKVKGTGLRTEYSVLEYDEWENKQLAAAKLANGSEFIPKK